VLVPQALPQLFDPVLGQDELRRRRANLGSADRGQLVLEVVREVGGGHPAFAQFPLNDIMA
jgi:hypothetical protein